MEMYKQKSAPCALFIFILRLSAHFHNEKKNAQRLHSREMSIKINRHMHNLFTPTCDPRFSKNATDFLALFYIQPHTRKYK